MEKRKPITLGGRTFFAIGNSTMEHDVWFMGHVRRADLDRLPMVSDESPEEFAHRLLSDVLASGRALPLVGALILPEGTRSEEWTPEIGEETARFLGGLTADEDKLTIQQFILSLLIPFLTSGLGSLKILRPSSEPEGDQTTTPESVPDPIVMGSGE